MTPIQRLLAAAAVVVCSGAAVAQSLGDQPLDDAEANRRASDNYNAVLQDRPAFRAEREQLECAGIESLDLRAQCLATFDRPASPSTGTPAAPRPGPGAPPRTLPNPPPQNPANR